MATLNQFAPVGISLGEDLAGVAEQLRRSTVEVRGPGFGCGSGVIWRPDGLIVTNAHVATSRVHTVRLADGRSLRAEVIRREPRLDLALLKAEATALPAVRTRDASTLRTGELVLAVGNPMEATGAFAVGLLAATPRADDVLVRADIRLAPGNSGGPLADAEGRVLGVNSMIVGGFGVAVSSAVVEHLLAGDRFRAAEVA